MDEKGSCDMVFVRPFQFSYRFVTIPNVRRTSTIWAKLVWKTTCGSHLWKHLRMVIGEWLTCNDYYCPILLFHAWIIEPLRSVHLQLPVDLPPNEERSFLKN